MQHRDLKLFLELQRALRKASTQIEKRAIIINWIREHPGLFEYLSLCKDPKRRFMLRPDECDVPPAEFAAQHMRGPIEILRLFERNVVRRDIARAMWSGYLARLRRRSLKRAANCLLEKRLRCGVRNKTLDSALVKLGFRPFFTRQRD
jgi:hypothetical protein